ncbi:hypothetical protein CFIMG_007763RA00001 [Ceratocystis fimbriata CBS 114723]|uniref:Uncharacterized protein n=1 Tax=Ceratocystis fimbriata CBS 114723 TaxID=1035309 RepID=A0A2C5WUA4_9PEZI|nr:hypothetical protein CFIMG_007763RA00001 [Ceratocystis fimbriata CBS 114723]
MGLKNQLQSPRSSRYLLYIPTDSEYSRLVSSKPTKAELEKILHDARVLDRPGGGRRRVKRFFLLENRSDTDDGHNTFRSEPVIRSRHASRHVIRENRVTDLDRNIPSCSSPSNHLSSRKSSEQLPGEETPASQSPALGDSPAQSVPLQTSRLNPEATEFQPMALPITSTPSVNSNVLDDTSVNLRDSRHSQSNFASGPSRTENTSDASSCTAASPSQHIFCDGTNEGPSPRVSPTFNYNSRATSGQLPVPIIPFGLTPQFPNVIPPFQVPHDSAHLSFQTA